MHCEEKLKFRSHNTSYLILIFCSLKRGQVTDAGVTVFSDLDKLESDQPNNAYAYCHLFVLFLMFSPEVPF